MTDFPRVPLDPALLELLELVQDGDFATPVPRCGALLRRARALGLVRDNDHTTGRMLLVTDAGAEALASA